MLKHIIILVSLVAVVAGTPRTSWSQTGKNLDVALILGKSEVELEFAGTVRETRFETIELHWYESLLSHLDGGVSLGYVDVSQATNPIIEGQTTTGEYLEIGLRAYYYRSPKLTLSSDLSYRYSQASNEQSTQSIDWQWHRTAVSLQAELQLGEYLVVSLGGSLSRIDGEERATGAITQIIDFGEKKTASGHLGAQIILDHTGHVGIKIDTGSQRGGRIYFQRWF